jgi:DNA recombination protein RmuC
MTEVILYLIFALAAGIVAWIIRKLIFEKNSVPIADFEQVKQQLQERSSALAVAENTASVLKGEKQELATSLKEIQEKLQETSNSLIARVTHIDNLQLQLTEAKEACKELNSDAEHLQRELSESKEVIVNLKAEAEFRQEKLNTQKAEMDNLGKKFEDSFKVLAQQILDDKSKTFNETQEKNLKGILEPLEKEIKRFKEDIETKQKHESEERVSLKEQVKHMTTLNQTLSEQANKLTETLRLQVKQQGDWGESILEAILENSGLQKDLQYFTQQSSRNNEGKLIRPDVVIKYPDDRKIIIDSKVSLTHYYNMCSAVGEDEQQSCLQQLIASIRNHIDELSYKNYADIAQALDFIIMFVPVEPAYIAAMHADPDLWQYAYKKGIFLISPANLITTLKMVKDMWQRNDVDKNAQEIADKAGKLYDKLVGFVETFEKVGTQLGKATDCWDDARKQLTSGKGNLISQAARMNALKINSKKELPGQLISEAILNDDLIIESTAAEETLQ